MAATCQDITLPRRWVAKPWGVAQLPPPFARTDRRDREPVGEIWFEPPPGFDRLLVKYLFTSEALSVQVHPSDAQTMAAGMGRQGKEECWLVLDAKPGAKIGMGLREAVDADRLRAAALDGSIESLLDWQDVRAGDFFYIPANTIHAICGGLSILEIQQNSDITYRLYDYGRPRELHLEEAVAVAHRAPHEPRYRRSDAIGSSTRLVDGPLFRLDCVVGTPSPALAETYAGPLLAIPLAGMLAIGAQQVAPGECALAPSLAAITFAPEGTCLIAQPRDA